MPRLALRRLVSPWSSATALALWLASCGAQGPAAASNASVPEPASAAPAADSPEGGARDGATRTAEGGGETSVHEIHRDVAGVALAAFEAGPTSASGVLLLHGGRFHRGTWRELGTLERLASEGRRVVAIDLPGFGTTPALPPERTESRADVLRAALAAFGFEHAVVVAPSMSGCTLLPLLDEGCERVAGVVPVAPACIEDFAGPSEVPALLLWGEQDTVIPLTAAPALSARFAEAELVTFPGAAHPCYLDEPERFHQVLSAFVARVLGG